MQHGYLKLSSKSRQFPRLCNPGELSDGNPDVCSSYLSIPTCGQLIQCIVDESILEKNKHHTEKVLPAVKMRLPHSLDENDGDGFGRDTTVRAVEQGDLKGNGIWLYTLKQVEQIIMLGLKLYNYVRG